ncbi:MAG: putative Ig domain-containing protein [Planctomycetaceae bacterium]|nr:putative Ig domain-containing protein [Planctomycetaceae bacterium]
MVAVIRRITGIVFLALFVSASVLADVTYWLHSSVPSDAAASVQEAVAIYNRYGSFNKHLVVYYDSNPDLTANGSYNGTINFGTQRTTRTALHEMGHTVGMGTYTGWPSYSSLLVGGVWQGYYGWNCAIEIGNGGLWGDGHAIWPGGMNYETEDTSFAERIKHVRIMAAIRCDMGIASFSKEPQSQIVPLGGTAVFGAASPTASGFQWYKNGVALTNGGDISGATSGTLQIANVDAADAANYYCAATGANETLNSRSRRLILSGQVGQWNLEGNANDSVGSYNGTPSGAPAYIAGKIGQAIVLDGVDDYVTLPAGAADAHDITVAAWVYWNGGGQWQRIFDFGTSTSQYLFLTPRSGDNTLRFVIKDGGSEQIAETTQLATGQWIHLAVTLRNDAATLYVNGKAAAANGTATIDPLDFMADRNYIGKSQWPDPLFNGRIDDFRIYNFALSGSEIWNLWGQSVTNNPPMFAVDPLVLPDGNANIAYTGQTLADYASDLDGGTLSFSKVSGPAWLTVAANGTISGTPAAADRGENAFVARVTDPAGAADDVTIYITVTGSADAHYPFEGNADDIAGTNDGTATGNPAYAAGILGQAIDLDGTDDYVTLPAGIINTDNFTVAAWVRWDGGAQWQRIFDFGNNTAQNMFLTPTSESNTLRFAITASGNGASEQRIETAALATGQWVHVAVTLDGNSGKLYVNGQLKALNAAMTIDPADFNPAVNYIGKSQWPDALFNGRIDDFRIYHYALNADQIALLSLPPAFTSDPISNLDAIELAAYAGQSLTAYVDAPLGTSGLTFSKASGPNWLVVASDGTLSGIPNDSNVGQNFFEVRVQNQAGLYDTAQMNISVANVFSGVRGLEDLLGLASQWLMLDCLDTPACAGADLNDDADVTAADFSVLSHHWLADEDLQLDLKFDDLNGTAAQDTSIYGRNGLLVNGPAWDGSGHSNGALQFDGTNDYVQVTGYKGVTGSGSRTCTAWVKTTTPSSQIIGWGSTAATEKWMIRVNDNGALRAEVQGGSVYGTIPITDGNWHHVAVVLADDGSADISEALLYVDGMPEPISGVSPCAVKTAASGDVRIGVNVPGNIFFQGLLDDVRVYDRALTGNEILAISLE